MSVIPVCLSEYNYIYFIVLKADGFVLLDSSFWFYFGQHLNFLRSLKR